MLYVDIPTLPEFKGLAATRDAACISIYLPTTPMTQHTDASRIDLRNLTKSALAQLGAAGFDRRRTAAIGEQLVELANDDAFWTFQAMSLAVLATPETIQTFRLPNRLTAMAEVSDRFHLKPLLRAITFPHEAFILALSENDVRLIEVFADLPAHNVQVDDLPKRGADDLKFHANANRSRKPSDRDIDRKNLLRKYVRNVDGALRAVLAGRETPLVLAATEPLASIFRAVSTYPCLVAEGIVASPDRISDADLATAARPILDGVYARDLETVRALFAERRSQSRATGDISDAARAATYGAIEQLMIDIDEVIPGTVDEMSGRVAFANGPCAKSYGIVDEIAGRALLSGARVLGVRKADIPDSAHLAAILRYPI